MSTGSPSQGSYSNGVLMALTADMSVLPSPPLPGHKDSGTLL